MASEAFKTNNNEVVCVGGRANETVVNLFNKSKNNKFRNSIYILNIKAIEKLNFVIPNAKKTFNYLQLAFIKTLIFQDFDLESQIWIKTNALGYIIGEMLSELNLDSNITSNNLNKSDFGQ